MNVWVENGDLLIYISRSGFFDENNTLLKAGRLRLHIEGNPLASSDFKQILSLDEGCIYVKGGEVTIRIWADVHNPVIFATLNGKKMNATLSYESWRYKDLVRPQEACQQDSWKWASSQPVYTKRDSISATQHVLRFFHQNPENTIFDFTVSLEHLDEVKDKLYNPIGGLRFGGILSVPDFTFNGTSTGKYASTDYKAWNYYAKNISNSTIRLDLTINRTADGRTISEQPCSITAAQSLTDSKKWWHAYWQRSYIKSDTPEAVHVLRNYELFRYMLGCNAYGEWPTKFNGGLFCFDPIYVQSNNPFTPDFRCWGGGTMTAQNQRLVYWPMLKSGDVDMMASQFDTYLRMLQSAKARVEKYWHHDGACFTEQIENFGLPNPAEYGDHKDGDDFSRHNNLWLEYLYDTSLEFCQMILLANEYTGLDIEKYKPLIRECLIFFDEHYRKLARERGAQELSDDGKLILYPGSGAETHKMAYNACSTIAALRTVLETINTKHGGLTAWSIDSTYLDRIPEIPFKVQLTDYGKRRGEDDYEKWIAPAITWMRIQNEETTQLYPVFPWRMYGLGRPDIEVARNTYYDDPWAIKMRSSKGWKQDNIWAALVGDKVGCKKLCIEKFKDGPYRFPAFWENGFDWSPDHNRGGSAMIGLEEMLLQERPSLSGFDSTKSLDCSDLMVFPCWPKEWNCEFRLKATGNRTIDATFVNGHVTSVTCSYPSTIKKNKIETVSVNRPLRVSIFGDSYSTFEGYIPEVNEPWYFYPNSKGKCAANNVDRPDQTWWYQTIEMLDTMAYRLGNYNGARLEKNDSYSGSTIGYTGYIIPQTGKHDDYKPRSFITRAPRLGNPDLILLCGATNDSWDGEEIGEYKYTDWEEKDFYTFRPAMAKLCVEMKKLYPSSRVLFIINSELKESIVESIRKICDHYCIEYLELKDIDKQVGHPSRKGMSTIAKQVVKYLSK